MLNLQNYNTFGLRVYARNIVHIEDIKQLALLDTKDTIILGKGSDVLFTEDYEGTILVNQIKTLSIEEKNDYFEVKVGGGYILDEFIDLLVSKNIYGLENLSAIPGTVGAAPIQNVGAYGVEIGDFISDIDVYDLETKLLFTLNKKDCKFSYRNSIFKEQKNRRYFITHITFHLNKEFQPKLTYSGLPQDIKNAKDLREFIINIRALKLPDPKFVGNAGSFFKNPFISLDKIEKIKEEFKDLPVYKQDNGTYKVSAGFLIDKAGCRGITHGKAGTWANQALVIVNRGDAKPFDIVSIAKYVCICVKNKFDIDLYPEVRIYGRSGEILWENL